MNASELKKSYEHKTVGVEFRTVNWLPNYKIYANGIIVGPRGVLIGEVSNKGYRRINVRSSAGLKKYGVHRLVCEAFHGPAPTSDHIAAHGDGDCTNNNSYNLRWATRKENEEDKIRHGTAMLGEKNHITSLTESAVINIRRDRNSGISYVDLAKTYGVSSVTCFNVCHRITWGHVQ